MKTYLCPACGTRSSLLVGSDRFIHEDGSVSRRCWRLIHGSRTPFRGPRGEALVVAGARR